MALTCFVLCGTCLCWHEGGDRDLSHQRSQTGHWPCHQLAFIPGGCGGVSHGLWNMTSLRGALMPQLFSIEGESWKQGSLFM